VYLRPVPCSPKHSLIPILQNMLRSLPAKIYRLASKYLMAIFLVEHNFGSAFTEAVKDSQGQWSTGYMLLNLTAFNRPADEWASWRENSAFHSAGNFHVRVILEEPQNNTIESALRFIFLHELGHILGIGLKVHGYWDDPETHWLTKNSSFMRISWEPDQTGRLVSSWKFRFPLLTRIVFYRFEQAPLSKAVTPKVYRELAQTNFTSLYGSLNPVEDFAEAFALYVHTQILNRPYLVEVHRGTEKIGVYKSCIQRHTCPGKSGFVANILK